VDAAPAPACGAVARGRGRRFDEHPAGLHRRLVGPLAGQVRAGAGRGARRLAGTARSGRRRQERRRSLSALVPLPLTGAGSRVNLRCRAALRQSRTAHTSPGGQRDDGLSAASRRLHELAARCGTPSARFPRRARPQSSQAAVWASRRSSLVAVSSKDDARSCTRSGRRAGRRLCLSAPRTSKAVTPMFTCPRLLPEVQSPDQSDTAALLAVTRGRAERASALAGLRGP